MTLRTRKSQHDPRDGEVRARPRSGLFRSWRSVVFTAADDDRRRRRGSDGVRLAFALLALACCLLIIRYNSRIDRAIIQVIYPAPWSITWLITVVYRPARSA
jgi:hypothetical protein